MNKKETCSLVSFLGTAKWRLYKLVSWMAVALVATTANAMTCPSLNAILGAYVKNNALVADHQLDPNNDWKLSWHSSQPYLLFKNAHLQNKSVKVKTWANAANPNSTTIDKVTCEYQDANNLSQPDRLFLTITSIGQLSVSSYISSGGYIPDVSGWENNAPKDEYGFPVKGAPVTEYSCSDLSKCGTFSFEKKTQENGFWKDAWYWCWMTHAGCRGENGYVARIEALDNTRPPQVDFCMPAIGFEPPKCYYKPGNPPQCKEPLCKEELYQMFGIIGGRGFDTGMAQYLNICWRNQPWQYKEWAGGYESNTKNCPDSNDLVNKEKTWPNYEHFGITTPWYNEPGAKI